MIFNRSLLRSLPAALFMGLTFGSAGYPESTLAGACASTYCITWSTIDSGGITVSGTDDEQWSLAGTIGQADASEAFGLSSGQWRLTGGFWSIETGDLADEVFVDRFED